MRVYGGQPGVKFSAIAVKNAGVISSVTTTILYTHTHTHTLKVHLYKYEVKVWSKKYVLILDGKMCPKFSVKAYLDKYLVIFLILPR